MRKFIFSTAMLSVLTGGWSTVQATRHGPKDWRLILMWVSWAIGAAIAIGTVVEESKERRLDS
ncbi:hypothetical protein [Leifsonia sp. A12D58]|uniref:hypothetical protein n=1 Tax=Leifsonia sp. A12D58 TaxID=3397674 RepID=UPI0039DF2F3B